MAEKTTSKEGLQFVSPDVPQYTQEELSSSGYVGSMQQVLSQNAGKYVICEFLIGTQNIVRKEGILYFTGVSYIVLYEVADDRYVVCDFYSLKFVTFYESGIPSRPIPHGPNPQQHIISK